MPASTPTGRRLLLLPYPALALVMALAYMLGDPSRTATPSFNTARSITSLPHWGLLFLAGSVVMTAAIIGAKRQLLTVALFVGGTIYTWWATLFAVTAFTDPRASLTGWAVHGTVAFAHYAAGARAARQTDLLG